MSSRTGLPIFSARQLSGPGSKPSTYDEQILRGLIHHPTTSNRNEITRPSVSYTHPTDATAVFHGLRAIAAPLSVALENNLDPSRRQLSESMRETAVYV